MKIDLSCENKGFLNLIENKKLEMFLDANFFISPDRSAIGVKAFSFESFKDIWLDAIFKEFDGLHIHESVADELVADNIKDYVRMQEQQLKIKKCLDSELAVGERMLMEDYKYRLSKHSKYDPVLDCAKDRGEILTLSYMAVKQYTYLGANDFLPIRLIKEANALDTGLEAMEVIQMYEIIFYLYKSGYDKDGLRKLYKYQYYLTKKDKNDNPDWGNFIKGMENLYGDIN